MTDEKLAEIQARIKEDYDFVVNSGYRCLGVFLQGSQNYQLDYEESDIDTKAIIIPSLEDVVLNKQPVSTTHVREDSAHIDLKDIRLMFNNFRKQNINFLEILFTKYKYVNPDYADFWQKLVDQREVIAHYDNYAAVNCINGMILEKRAALCKSYPSTQDKIEKYGYDPKQLHHILRANEFQVRFIAGEPYEECLIPYDTAYLVQVKAHGEMFTVEEAVQLADEVVAASGKVKDRYKETHQRVINASVDDLLNKVVYEVIKKSFKADIL